MIRYFDTENATLGRCFEILGVQGFISFISEDKFERLNWFSSFRNVEKECRMICIGNRWKSFAENPEKVIAANFLNPLK